MKTNPILPPLVSPTDPEELDRSRLQTLSEDELLQECIDRLHASHKRKGTTFHETHDALSRARLECDRREQSAMFDDAFRIAFYDH